MNGNASLGESNTNTLQTEAKKHVFTCYKSDLIDKLSNLISFMVSSAEYAAPDFTKYIVQ